MDLENINPNPQLSLFEENNKLIQELLNESLKGMLKAVLSGKVKYRVQDALILKNLNDSLNSKATQKEVIYIGFDGWEQIDGNEQD